MDKELQFCTFFLDGLLFGVEVSRVQEVLSSQNMTEVPLAPPVVKGLINLRGQIVTALDLTSSLNLREDREGKDTMNVVVRTSEEIVSLLVDQIGDVCEVEEDSFESPPDNLEGMARELIRGAYKLEDRLLLVLDIEKAVELTVR